MAGLLARSRPIFEKGAPYLNRLFRLPEPDVRGTALRSRRLLLLTVPSFFGFWQIGPVSAFLWNSQNHRNRCPLLLSVPSFCSCLQLGRVSAYLGIPRNYRKRRPLLLSVLSFCCFFLNRMHKNKKRNFILGNFRPVAIYFGGSLCKSTRIGAS